MTEPQRRKLVISGTSLVVACVALYLIVFGFQGIDLKAMLLLVGFFAVVIKIATIKHKRNPMI